MKPVPSEGRGQHQGRRVKRQRPKESRLTEDEVRVAELRHRGYSLARIDTEMRLPQGGAAKKLRQLRKKSPALIRLVRRLQDIHYWERSLDRKTMLKNMRAKQIHAREAGGWLYGRPPSGRYLDKDGKLRLEPVESGIITGAGERVTNGERVYSIAPSTGYDHRTLRDILKNPLNKELFPNSWNRLQEMLKKQGRDRGS